MAAPMKMLLGAPITTDQRGVHRPHGRTCDMGAFESDDIIFANGFDPLIGSRPLMRYWRRCEWS